MAVEAGKKVERRELVARGRIICLEQIFTLAPKG
jgi:hypothetical protein